MVNWRDHTVALCGAALHVVQRVLSHMHDHLIIFLNFRIEHVPYCISIGAIDLSFDLINASADELEGSFFLLSEGWVMEFVAVHEGVISVTTYVAGSIPNCISTIASCSAVVIRLPDCRSELVLESTIVALVAVAWWRTIVVVSLLSALLTTIALTVVWPASSRLELLLLLQLDLIFVLVHLLGERGEHLLDTTHDFSSDSSYCTLDGRLCLVAKLRLVVSEHLGKLSLGDVFFLDEIHRREVLLHFIMCAIEGNPFDLWQLRVELGDLRQQLVFDLLCMFHVLADGPSQHTFSMLEVKLLHEVLLHGHESWMLLSDALVPVAGGRLDEVQHLVKVRVVETQLISIGLPVEPHVFWDILSELSILLDAHEFISNQRSGAVWKQQSERYSK